MVEITTDESGHHSVYNHYPDVFDGVETPYATDLTNAQWKRLMDTLFRKLCVHEWKQSYVDPCVRGWNPMGTGTETLTRGRHYRISGSNDFQPFTKTLSGHSNHT